LVEKFEGKRPLGRPRRRWEDNTKIYIKELGLEIVEWVRLAQNRDKWLSVLNTAMNLLAP
jgi:hypothetical protein